MKEYNLLQLSKKLTSRGLGIKISKNPVLKEELLKLTCFLPDSAPQSLRIWCLKNDILSKEKLPKCPVCGKLPAFSTGKFRTYCSKRCSQLGKEKFIKKYGVEHHLKSKSVKEKRKKTVLEKYGVENIGIITKEKARKTTLEKYGVDNYTKTKEYKEKLVQTSLLKYGTTHPMKSEKVKKKVFAKVDLKENVRKAKITLLKKYSVDSPMKILSIKEKVLKKYKKKVWERLNIRLEAYNIKPLFSFHEFKTIKVKNHEKYPFLCLTCNSKFFDHLNNGHIPVCPNCLKGQSKPERIITLFLQENEISFESNNRTVISPFEIDIYIPNKKLGIEINGIYYHTVENLIKYRNLSEKEAKKYHRLKWLLAKDQDIYLLQFWDSEIIRKKEIVLSIISSALGINNRIFAKDCKVKEVEEETAYKFFVENHINDEHVLGRNFALLKDNEIIQVISIGKVRFGLDGYEIYRLATKKGYTVVGGLKKLIKRAYMEIGFKKLYSYVNLRIFSGKGYEKVGFKRVKITEPDYYYTKDFINLYSRERFMRSKTGIPEKEFINKPYALYLLEI
jgi:endogenous inhibitor of DNA gyrase (YacG/DUF329 family)/very-short-patch-repair endonuclease